MNFSKVDEEIIDEVTAIRGQYKMIFSDGVGSISPSVAKQVLFILFLRTEYLIMKTGGFG